MNCTRNGAQHVPSYICIRTYSWALMLLVHRRLAIPLIYQCSGRYLRVPNHRRVWRMICCAVRRPTLHHSGCQYVERGRSGDAEVRSARATSIPTWDQMETTIDRAHLVLTHKERIRVLRTRSSYLVHTERGCTRHLGRAAWKHEPTPTRTTQQGRRSNRKLKNAAFYRSAEGAARARAGRSQPPSLPLYLYTATAAVLHTRLPSGFSAGAS